MWDRLSGCIQSVTGMSREFIADIVLLDEDSQQFHEKAFRILCSMKEKILELYRQGANIRCNLVSELREIEESFPSFTDDPTRRDAYLQQVYSALLRMLAYIFQYMIDCICDAFLIPCPECDDREGVLLACVTVQDDKVKKICNVVRTQVISGPAIHYWMQPLFNQFCDFLEYLCCQFDLVALFERAFQPRTKGFQSMHSAFMGGSEAFSMVNSYASAAWANMKTLSFINFISAETLGAAQIFNRPANEARATFKKMKVTVVEKQAATRAEAYSLKNLAEMAWIVPPGSRVELLLSPDNLVTSVRLLKEEEK